MAADVTTTAPTERSGRRFDLDTTWHRVGRRTLLAGSPVRLLRVTDAGRRILDDLEDGRERPDDPLIRRLLDAGVIHPRTADLHTATFAIDDVTVVTPQLGGTAPTDGRIVVDDGSPIAIPGATLRLDSNRGPAAARNAGRRHAATALIAFVDADVVTGDWLRPLLGHFDDPQVGLVAARVVGDERSSLDMGPRPALVRSGTRVSYVPAAAIVVRAEALDDVGGFDEMLRYGEDVDLVWRLDDAGWVCRYEPRSVVWHRPRETWRGRLAQQAGYGSAAAPLAVRHPRRLAPWRGDAPLALLTLLLAAGFPSGAALIAVTQVRRLRRQLPDLSLLVTMRLIARADVDALRHAATALRRVWWPIAVLLAIPSRRMRRTLLAAIALAPTHAVHDIAYGSGVWRGMRRARTWQPLLPRIQAPRRR